MTVSMAHVVATTDDPSAGPSYSVPALVSALAAQGHAVDLLTVSGWRGFAADPGAAARVGAAHHVRFRQSAQAVPGVAGLCWSEELRRALDRAARDADVIHTHGLWLMPNVFPSWSIARPGARARLVLSPRGMLGAAALRYSNWKKDIFWRLVQKRALDRVSAFHATSRSEYEEIRAAGLTVPVAVIPNGVDVWNLPPGDGEAPARTVLSLGRVHPKKGLDRLLRAWAVVGLRHGAWSLRIAGPDEGGHAAELRALAESLSLPRVTIEGALHGERKTDALRQASLFVLPSLNENFAMTVAEALAAGVPVISTRGAPWAGLEERRCGWWIDHGVDALAGTLDDALSRPAAELRQMGERGRAWMGEEYGWPGVATRMADLYAWLVGHGDRPGTVIVD